MAKEGPSPNPRLFPAVTMFRVFLALLTVCLLAVNGLVHGLWTERWSGLTEQAVASYKFQTISRLKEMARRAGLSFDELGGG